ncbi:MAG TPA: PKD domain-containing protein [Thermoplasmata archaeon]|nr:PKD domain-containing protein [Thermoplasmata archaeon]
MSSTVSRIWASRTIVASLVVAFVAAGLLALARPVPAAAPTAPWFSPNVIVNAPPAYTGYQPSLGIDGEGILYLAFGGWGGSTTQADVFFTKSMDGGRTWSAPFKVNNDIGGAIQTEPSLFIDHNSVIYIAWTDTRNGNQDVFFSKSADRGLSFSANVRVNDVTANFQTQPDIAVDGTGLIHAVWTDGRNALSTGPDIYYANSTDGGLSFNPSLRVNNDAVAAEQGEPSIAVASDRSVYAVWTDPRNGARGQDIYFSKSTDLGATWSPNFFLNDDAGNRAQNAADLAVDSLGTVYVAWADSRDTNTGPDIYATRSSNGGASFAANVRVNDDVGTAYQGSPSLAVNAGRVHAAWADERTRGSTWRDVYSASSPDGLAWGTNMKVTDDSLSNNLQDMTTITADGSGDAYVAWFDGRVSGQDVFASTLDVVAPVADAGASRTVDQGVGFVLDGSASTDNLGMATYAWNFGDGSTASATSVSHSYATPGAYSATLTVTDRSGNTGSAVVTITVRDTVAPAVRGGGDRIVDEGQPLFFDASASTDNVGVASTLWIFGDNSTSSQAALTHVYATRGTYDASVTVTDADGNSQTVRFTVTVRPVSPTGRELLGMVQTLDWIIAILAIALAIVGFLAFTTWRRKEQHPGMPMPPHPQNQIPPPPPA